jgi:hypothetical protein
MTSMFRKAASDSIVGLKVRHARSECLSSADPLPAGFVERPEKFAEIKKKLLDAQGEPVQSQQPFAALAALERRPLRSAVSRSEIEDASARHPPRDMAKKPEDLVGRIADLIVVLTGERPDVTHLEAAKRSLPKASTIVAA